jgi:hypothetical protein
MKKGVKSFLNILNSKPVIGTLIFVMLSLAMVFAGNVIVREGSVTIENNINGSNVFFVNQTTGNVGIGISNPSTKLDVTGDIKSSGAIYTNTGTMTSASSAILTNVPAGQIWMVYAMNDPATDYSGSNEIASGAWIVFIYLEHYSNVVTATVSYTTTLDNLALAGTGGNATSVNLTLTYSGGSSHRNVKWSAVRVR